MQTSIGLAVLTAAAVTLSGCGSSNLAASTVTVTAATTSNSASTESASRSAELQRYLSQVDAQQQQYEAARTRALATLTRANRAGSVAIASKEANAIRRASDDFSELAVAMGGIDAPPPLREAHAGLVKSLQLFSQLLDDLQDGLRRQDSATLQQVTNSDISRRVDELRATWRIAIMTEARRQDVEVPHRLTRVGRTG
jgi:hypothetical protein